MSLSLFRYPLARELTAVIAIKVILIVLAALFLFGARQRPRIDAAAAFQHLFARTPPQR
jgi:hypothetical protein